MRSCRSLQSRDEFAMLGSHDLRPVGTDPVIEVQKFNSSKSLEIQWNRGSSETLGAIDSQGLKPPIHQNATILSLARRCVFSFRSRYSDNSQSLDLGAFHRTDRLEVKDVYYARMQSQGNP